MNKNKFRVVFNKARGLMVVVAENVGSYSSKSTQSVSTASSPAPIIMLCPVWISILIMSSLMITVSPAKADIIADPSAHANQRPIVNETANGLPLVNIQTPSAAGVSRNSYRQFDVKTQGAILNNSNTNTQTQLGGWVQGNPHLAGGTAKVILNEVNSHNPSLLNGYIEVAGSRAQVVIANPAGISCSGCGFINANRATLTTGKPIINNGNLLGYRVGGGNINFLGNGLDTSQTNFTDVIARAVDVNAGIWANELSITTGTNQVNVDSNGNQTSINPIVPDAGNAAPAFTVDVAALGGMYAGKIHMVGTESGLGVRNASDIGASVGAVTITADGMLQNTGTISAKTNIQLTTTGLESEGSVGAEGNITIHLASDYVHTGDLQAGGNLDLRTTGDITNQSTMLASQSLNLSANNIDNTVNGEITGLNTQMVAEDRLTNHGLIDGVETVIYADTLINEQTGSIFGDQIGIQVAHLGNDTGALIAARDRLDIGAGTIENRNDSLMFSAGDLAIAGSLDGANQAIGSADSLINDGATIEALGQVTLTIADLQNLNANLVTQLVQTGSGSFDRFTPRSTSVILNAADYPGARIGDESISWRTAGSYTFREYHRYRGTTVTRETHVIDSAPGQIFSGGDMVISGSITNSDSQIIAGGALDVSGASLQNLNTQGEIRVRSRGHAYYYDYDGSGSGFRYDVDYLGAYNPADVVTTFNLSTSEVTQNTLPAGSGTTVSSATVPVVTNSLFQASPDIAATYLIETNPLFANYRSWLSSDYMMQQLSFDPATTQKRLGDGFYEQRLVREQIAQLTGRRFLDGHATDEAQYQALMTSALTQVDAVQLVPGVALSAEQVAQLTSDIVWLVEQTVTLPDGTVTQALVPQVYVKPQVEDFKPTTGMMAGNTVTMNLSADATNQGTIAGRELLTLNADNINNLGGQIVADSTLLKANNDINNIGGQVIASDAMVLEAGNDINLRSTTQSSKQRTGASRFSRTNIDRVAGLYVSNLDAIIVAAAGNDVNLIAANIVNQGEAGITQINAGENINLGTVQIAEQNSSVRNARNYVSHGGTKEVGTFIDSTGDIAFNSGNDFTATAATINSNTGAINITATQDINIQEGRETSNFDAARRVKRSSTFSSRTKTRRDTFESDNSLSSNLSGETVMLDAGNEINIRGSNVISDNGTSLSAGENVNITAASDTAYEFHERKTKTSGLSSSGASITLGSSQLNTKHTTNSTYLTGSTVGSVEGHVTINSGKTYTQKASDVLAPQGNIDISAQQVNIIAGQNTRDTTQETKFKQSGLTLSIQSNSLNLAQNVVNTTQSTLKSEGSRNKALNALQTYANSATLMEQGSAAINAIKVGEIQNAASSAGIKLSISVGSSKSESSSSSSLTNNQGSLVKAGGDISITATQDDLIVAGSNIAADKNVTLDAARNINLIASADKETNQSKNKSSSASIGISIGIGGEGTGLGVDLAASRGKGKANSDSLTYNNTQISAGETLALNSGNDTNLIGANISGKQVVADVAGDLNIESVQDIATSTANQSNTGISISIPIGAGIAGGSISNSKQKSNSNYASVYEQSGIKAGKDGFDITVAGNTDLKGAVIDSIATANKNQLTTGTLTVNDIQNHMDAEASSQGLTLSSDMLTSKYAAAKGLSSNLQNHGEADIKDSSTTLSGISAASITITDETAQIALTDKNAEETISSLNRDTSDTNRVLQRPDMAALQEKAQQEQADKLLLSATISTFTDEAFKKMFLAKAKVFEVERDDEGKVVRDSEGKPIMHEIDETEKFRLKANGENKKLNVFTNGLFNDESAAGAYSVQMAEAPVGEKVYVVHFPDANNFLSELLVAGYQKGLESAALGNTNATQEIINLSQIYGQDGLNLIGHSRGSMTIGNAMETLQIMGLVEPLSNTNIKFVGPAYSAQESANSLDTLSGGNQTSVELQNHMADFVGRLIGGNQTTYGEVPEGSSLIKEWINMFGEATNVHSCYGTGAISDNCHPTYGKPITVNIQSNKTLNQGRTE